jgi:hypothetical protein
MYYYTKNTGRRKRKREVEGDGNEQLTREDPFWIKWQVRLVGFVLEMEGTTTKGKAHLGQ